MSLCPCSSGKTFGNCCEVYLSGQKFAPTAEKLMRSRYTAYALGNYGKYLKNTWLPPTNLALDEIALNHQSTQWVGLKVLEKHQSGDNAQVSFCANYIDTCKTKKTMREISTFKRIDNKWFYIEGVVTDN